MSFEMFVDLLDSGNRDNQNAGLFRVFRRTPSPFASNSTPCFSNAARIFERVCWCGVPIPDSVLTSVLNPTPLSWDSVSRLQSRRARAARICAGVITGCFAVVVA